MISAMNQCKNFSLILINGVETQTVSKEDEMSIMLDWLMQNHQMDISTVFHINKMDGYWCGLIEINCIMAMGFTFTKNKIQFHLLPPNIGSGLMKICQEQWSRVWLYDVRIQASVALLIKIIKDKYPEIINDC